MRDLAVNLIASVIAGVAVWLAQRVRASRRLALRRMFFGMSHGAGCLLVTGRHAASPSELSVHRSDGAALMELASIAKDCGGRADLVAADGAVTELGRLTEFCVGGPTVNPRMAVHLRTMLPGVSLEMAGPGRPMSWRLEGLTFPHEPGRAGYVVLAKTYGPGPGPGRGRRPVFLIAGQTAATNLAAARYLAARYRQLGRAHGVDAPFCLVLRVVEPDAYGSDFVEIAEDVTGRAFRPRQPAGTATPETTLSPPTGRVVTDPGAADPGLTDPGVADSGVAGPGGAGPGG